MIFIPGRSSTPVDFAACSCESLCALSAASDCQMWTTDVLSQIDQASAVPRNRAEWMHYSNNSYSYSRAMSDEESCGTVYLDGDGADDAAATEPEMSQSRTGQQEEAVKEEEELVELEREEQLGSRSQLEREEQLVYDKHLRHLTSAVGVFNVWCNWSAPQNWGVCAFPGQQMR